MAVAYVAELAEDEETPREASTGMNVAQPPSLKRAAAGAIRGYVLMSMAVVKRVA
jgi:hypothetical protein